VAAASIFDSVSIPERNRYLRSKFGMAARNTPLSPHLQIYRMPVAALLSITHRATGVFLTLGTVVLVYWLVAVARGPDAYAGLQETLGSWYGIIGLFLWSFALFFHLCNGITCSGTWATASR
jgi:succinate dehydrogenase / fumarate reductase cytochrome b subunit